MDDDLKNETGGNFMESIVALFMIPYEYEAKCIRNALRVGLKALYSLFKRIEFKFFKKGFGTNEKVCIQILCTKEAFEIQQLKAAYSKCCLKFYLSKGN